jgi:hypothetical protein
VQQPLPMSSDTRLRDPQRSRERDAR